jgi:hypothetical protein
MSLAPASLPPFDDAHAESTSTTKEESPALRMHEGWGSLDLRARENRGSGIAPTRLGVSSS